MKVIYLYLYQVYEADSAAAWYFSMALVGGRVLEDGGEAGETACVTARCWRDERAEGSPQATGHEPAERHSEPRRRGPAPEANSRARGAARSGRSREDHGAPSATGSGRDRPQPAPTLAVQADVHHPVLDLHVPAQVALQVELAGAVGALEGLAPGVQVHVPQQVVHAVEGLPADLRAAFRGSARASPPRQRGTQAGTCPWRPVLPQGRALFRADLAPGVPHRPHQLVRVTGPLPSCPCPAPCGGRPQGCSAGVTGSSSTASPGRGEVLTVLPR